MTDAAEAPPPSELVLDPARTLAAVRLAVREALLDHKHRGNSVVIWEDGQVRWIAAEDIVIPDEANDRQVRSGESPRQDAPA